MYVAIYSFLVLLGAYVRQENARVWIVIIFIFLLWFMGYRYYVGCDFTGYLYRFEISPLYTSWYEMVSSPEPGFTLLITSVRALDLDYVWLNITASFIILFGFSRFLRAFDFPIMILAILFPIIIIQLSMSGIRQAIAVSMLMASSAAFMRGKKIPTALWILVGSTFHISVIIFLPIALLAGRKISSLRLAASVFLLAPAALALAGDRFDTYQDRYIDQIYGEVSSGGALIRYGMVLLPSLLFLKYRNKLKLFFPNQYEILKLFTLISFAMAPLAVISSLVLHRMNYYVMPFSIVMLVYFSVILGRTSRDQRMAIRLLPAVFYGGYMIFWLMLSRHADWCYLPYRNYLLL